MGKKKRADYYKDVDDINVDTDDFYPDIDAFYADIDDFYLEVMGHDVNNLNQVILANLELLQESNRLEVAQDQLLESAILATKDCAGTVKNVRALQSITAGAAESRAVDLDKAIRESIRDAPRPPGKKVTIRYTPLQEPQGTMETPGEQGRPGMPGPREKGMTVKAMPELKLVIGNLVGHAIKHSGPVVHVYITVSEVSSGREREKAAAVAGGSADGSAGGSPGGSRCLVTTITDDGNGIPEVVKEKLFVSPGQDAAVLHGQGLGLFTAKALAETSGGWLEVADRVPGDHEKGTIVKLALPYWEGT